MKKFPPLIITGMGIGMVTLLTDRYIYPLPNAAAICLYIIAIVCMVLGLWKAKNA